MNRREILRGLLATIGFGASTKLWPQTEAVQGARPPVIDLTAPRALRRPTIAELERMARGLGFEMTTEDLSEFRDLMDEELGRLRHLDQLIEPTLPVKYPRSPGYRPKPEENPLNAWYWKSSIKGASSGKLAGKKVVMKDNVCVAGVPMMNGSNVLEGYVPDIDATVVTRILDAGGEIVGKAVCESFCASGGSHTSDTGPVLNPHDRARSTGGSSSGCAALLAAREVDMAIGGDQGGSIRMPSSWCGIVGLKPTYGLVPYTGIISIELTLDHTGPMTRSVADCALLLEVIAGPDGLDPRQSGSLQPQVYSGMLTGDARGLRIGILREGFGWPQVSQPDVDAMVQDAAQRFLRVGATVREISVPMHRDGGPIGGGVFFEGMTMLLIHGNGVGTNWKGHYPKQLGDFIARGRRARANDFPDTMKLSLLLAQYLQSNYPGHYYAKAQNLSRVLRDAYDEAFKQVDLLVLPTTPMKATPIPAPNASRKEYIARAWEMIPNTIPFDVTGHPAISVPCGFSEGLPVGMMLVGRHGEDGTVLRAAHAFEQIQA